MASNVLIKREFCSSHSVRIDVLDPSELVENEIVAIGGLLQKLGISCL